jgi:hypothetical protein
MRKSNKTACRQTLLAETTEAFPSVRYFQIHFEYLHEQMALLLRNQDALAQRLQQLENQLKQPSPPSWLDSHPRQVPEFGVASINYDLEDLLSRAESL